MPPFQRKFICNSMKLMMLAVRVSPRFYSTNDSCAEYVKHLVKATKEQELALEKTKQDLAAKRQKIEDDDDYQQDPSDPESTISSLTTSSNAEELLPNSASSCNNSSKKRMSSDFDARKIKKPRNRNEEDSELNAKSSTSQSKNGTGESTRHSSHSAEESSKSSCSQTFGGVSSVGAVARGLHGRVSGVNHPDVIVNSYKKRSINAEATSMDSSFKLDYEEVFVKSSVPQLLATTAGRIVAWNDIFLKASGLLASDIDSVTIFSLVRQSELVKLFEIVAAALRSGTMQNREADSNDNPRTAEEASKPLSETPSIDYTAITLPCAAFRPRCMSDVKGKTEEIEKLLYMTVTLMTDNDPKKRCFHCVFTDSPGTNGALGSVTPELLSKLFNYQTNVPTVDDATTKNI